MNLKHISLFLLLALETFTPTFGLFKSSDNATSTKNIHTNIVSGLKDKLVTSEGIGTKALNQTANTQSFYKKSKVWTFRQIFFKISNICHGRFRHCSRLLSPEFCAYSGRNISFYRWAHDIVENIMDGAYDGYTTVKCSNSFTRHIIMKRYTNGFHSFM